MRQFFHFDSVLDDVSRWLERKTRISFVNWNDFQIDFRSKPPIQCNLALAKVAASFQRAEIKKAKIYRLFDFENEWRRDENP